MSRPSSVVPIFQNLRARRRLRERLVVAMDVLRVGQLAGRADGAAEKLERRWDGVGGRQMIDELGGDPRVLQVLLDETRVLLINLFRSASERHLREDRRAPGAPRGRPRRTSFARACLDLMGGILTISTGCRHFFPAVRGRNRPGWGSGSVGCPGPANVVRLKV